MQKASNMLSIVLFWGLLLLVFFIPLYFGLFFNIFGWDIPLLSTNIVFALPKAVFFSMGVEILLILYLIKTFLLEKQATIILPNTWISVVLLGWFGWMIVSLVFSSIPLVSFFGGYEKNQGVLMMLHYAVFLFLIIQIIQKDNVQTFFFTIVLSSLFVCLYALMQSFGWDPLQSHWAQEALKGRVFSTLGHPNYLSYYLLFVIPAALYMVVHKGHCFVRLFCVLVLLLQLWTLLLTQSRAAILGILLAMLILGVAFLWNVRKTKWLKTGILISLGMVLVSGTFLVVTPQVVSKLRLDAENTRSVESRLLIWKDTWEMIRERPLWGFGLESYTFLFPHFKSRELLDVENYNQNADRAHNFILDIWQSTGIIGLLWYVLLMIVLLYYARIIWRRDFWLGNVLLLALLSFWLALFWGFSVVTHDVYFYGVVALVVLYSSPITKNMDCSMFMRMITVVIMVFSLLGIWQEVRMYHADVLFKEALAKQDLSLLQQATDTSPFNYTYLLALANFSSVYPEGVFERLQTLTQGNDYEVLLLLAQWENKIGEKEGSAALFKYLVQFYPHIPAVYLAWGDQSYREGDTALCQKTFEQLLSISPDYWKYDGHIKDQPLAVQERYRLFFKENPSFRENFRYLSYCALANNDVDALQRYAVHMNETAEKYYLLYEGADKKGEREEAEKYFEKCRQMPDNNFCTQAP